LFFNLGQAFHWSWEAFENAPLLRCKRWGTRLSWQFSDPNRGSIGTLEVAKGIALAFKSKN
jgi:hypothetical protein